MQYTIRNIPDDLEKALRERADAQNRSIDDVALDALQLGLQVVGQKNRDLADLAGSMAPADALAIERAVNRMDSADDEARS